MAEKLHAKLSPSTAHRWLTCTRAPMIECSYPDQESPYAKEGTAAHAVCETLLRESLGEILHEDVEEEFTNIEGIDREMVSYAKEYVAFVNAEADALDAEAIFVEQRLDISAYAPECFGTGDCVLVGGSTLEIIDYKYGKGVDVEAEGNPQMQLYALGALGFLDTLYDIETIRLAIYQPRLSLVPKVAEMTRDELLAWGNDVVKPAAQLAYEGKGVFAPSEKACKFCKFKNDCRARAEHNLKAFDENPDPDALTIEEISEILKQAGDIKQWLSDLEARVFNDLASGQKVPGWKLVAGRSIRKLGDEEEVVKAFKKAGIKTAMLYEKSLITLTQMEKDFGKAFVGETLGDLIIKPEGKPTLAPEDDKRPAISVLADFDN